MTFFARCTERQTNQSFFRGHLFRFCFAVQHEQARSERNATSFSANGSSIYLLLITILNLFDFGILQPLSVRRFCDHRLPFVNPLKELFRATTQSQQDRSGRVRKMQAETDGGRKRTLF